METNSTLRKAGYQATKMPQLGTNPTTNLTQMLSKGTGKEREETTARNKPTWQVRSRRTHRTTIPLATAALHWRLAKPSPRTSFMTDQSTIAHSIAAKGHPWNRVHT